MNGRGAAGSSRGALSRPSLRASRRRRADGCSQPRGRRRGSRARRGHQSPQRAVLCSRSLASASWASCQASSLRSSMASSQARTNSSHDDPVSASRRSTASSASSAGRDPTTRGAPRLVAGGSRATGEPAVAECLLGCGRPVVVAAAHGSQRRSRAPTRRTSVRRDPPPPRAGGVRRGGAPRARPAQSERTSGGRRRPSRGREPRRSRRRPRPPARPPARRSGRLAPARARGRRARSSSAWTSEPKRPRQRERALEQPGRGALVISVERAPPRRQKPIARAEGERRVRSAQLGVVAGGLLEVVADELVQLDDAPSCPRASRRNGGAGPRERPSAGRRRRRRG